MGRVSNVRLKERDHMRDLRDGSSRERIPIGRDGAGRPTTYRVIRRAARGAAYRRLAIAILSLDVATLASELRLARRTMDGASTNRSKHLAPAA